VPLRLLRQWGVQGIDVVGIAACAIVALVFYLTTVDPLLRQRLATEALRRDIRAQQQRAADLQAATATAGTQLAAIRRELEVDPLQLDSAAHINRRIATLTEFFAACELHIDSMQTGRVSSGPQCDVIPITIVGRGAYLQCVRLLRGLCSLFPDMSVIRVEVAGNPANPAELERCRFELFWYATRGQTSSHLPRDGA
jgi:Tfp pilus assembly protein PilO